MKRRDHVDMTAFSIVKKVVSDGYICMELKSFNVYESLTRRKTHEESARHWLRRQHWYAAC